MRFCVSIVLFLISLSFSASAARQTGEIAGLVAYESGGKKIIIFKLPNNVSGGCNGTARFAFDSSKLNYDLMASTVLSAFHSKTMVQVEYTETCNAWGNSYDVRYVCLGDMNC